jgi:cobalamin biosynthesis protein CobT
MYGVSTDATDYHIGQAAPAFVNQARRLLQIKQAKYYTHGMKSGKVSASRLWRAGMPVVDDGDWNSRVFKKKCSHGDVTNTAITVLVDWSGSMGGIKAQAAAKAAGLLNDAFSRVLHIPLEILAFSTYGDAPVMGIIKPYAKPASSDQVAERFVKFLSHMGGNNDADSVQFAYQRILPRKEKRKILIVMSDGSPSDGVGDPSFALKAVTQDITAQGRVELYGVGIMDRNVERYYPKFRVLRSYDQIEPCLIELLTEALR